MEHFIWYFLTGFVFTYTAQLSEKERLSLGGFIGAMIIWPILLFIVSAEN